MRKSSKSSTDKKSTRNLCSTEVEAKRFPAPVVAKKTQVFTELGMKRKENRIPGLAETAVKQARANTLKAGRSVVEAVDGKLVESLPDGSQKVIKSIPAPIRVTADQKKVRRVK